MKGGQKGLDLALPGGRVGSGDFLIRPALQLYCKRYFWKLVLNPCSPGLPQWREPHSLLLVKSCFGLIHKNQLQLLAAKNPD